MDFEKSTIYVLLNNPELILKSDIAPSDFSNITLAESLQVMRSLSVSGTKVDLIVVIEKMKSPDAMQVMRDVNLNGIGVKENLKYYVNSIKELSLKKKLRNLLEITLDNLGDNSANSVVGDLTSRLSDLESKDVDHAYTSKEMMSVTLDHIDIMHDLKCDGKMAGVPSGMNKLDKELGGFHKSDLIIVGARPAMGKTAMAVSCAVNAANRGFKVGFISTEMSVVQVGMRVTSLISRISSHVMRDSSFNEQDWPRLTAGTQRIAKLPFYVFDKPVCRVSDIAMQARAWKANEGLDILFVDYLTRLKPESSSENKTIAIGNIVTDLKTLARSIDIPVVCLAQVSRQVEQRADKRPNMGDLRDSGVIEQEADQVLMLYRDSVYNRTPENTESAEINIEKNRHGAVRGLDMRFKPSMMEWCDKDDFDGYEYGG